MDQLGIEKRLTLCYVVCTALGAMSSISTGIAWGHWYQTLDRCVGRNCSCILYGKHTYSTFLGGDQAPCIWVTFGPLLYVFFALCMTCFHGYRVLFTTKSPTMRTTRSLLAKTENGSSVRIETIAQEDTKPLPGAFWVTLSVLTSIFFLYSLIHFSINLNGFYKTCNEYRKELEKTLKFQGTALPVIHNRLSCQAIFDFMDYMQMDTGRAYRNGFINTGLSLTLGIVPAFFACLSFFWSNILNIIMAKRRDE